MEIESELGVPDLRSRLAPYGSPATAPAPERVDDERAQAAARAEHLEGLGKLAIGRRREGRQLADQQARLWVKAETSRRQAAQVELQNELDALSLDLAERTAQARTKADVECAKRMAELEAAHAQEQSRLDAEWAQLMDNDPELVIAQLEEAFEDNESPAAPINCSGNVATVVMLFGHPTAIPEKVPALTPGGKPTLKIRSKSARNELYLASLASHILATAREGFAMCPGLGGILLMVVRGEGLGASASMAAIYAGTLLREDCSGAHWDPEKPVRAIGRPHDLLIHRKGQAGEIAPLDLSAEPELAAVLGRLAESSGVRPWTRTPSRRALAD